MKEKAGKLGIVDEDLISLIKWKKASEKERKNLVCNQLSMLDDLIFQDFFWQFKIVNKELYWEMQYLYLNHENLSFILFKKRIKNEFLYLKKQILKYFKNKLFFKKQQANFKLYIINIIISHS